MGRKKQSRVAAYPNPWPEHVTMADVYTFANREFATHIFAYATGHQERDSVKMVAEVKFLRGIVDKLDTFRRIKARVWAEEAERASEQKGLTT